MRGNKLRGPQRCFTMRRACVHANVQIGHPLLGVAFLVVPRASSRKKMGRKKEMSQALPKSLAALLLSVLLAFSLLAPSFGPANTAYASDVEGGSESDQPTVTEATYAEDVNQDYAWLSLGDTSYVTGNLALPTAGPAESVIAWASDDASITEEGIVTRPVFPDGNRNVTLTASISKESVSLTKMFKVRVISEMESGRTSAEYMLHQAKNYYEVVKAKKLEKSWWDISAVYGGWGSVEGYEYSSYWGTQKPGSGQPTDLAGVIFGLINTGKDPYHLPSGQNLVAELIAKQGTDGKFSTLHNQHMWSIIALNAANADVVYNGTNPDKPYNKEAAVAALLGMQKADGGYAFFGNAGDPDMTGMALIALSASKEFNGVDAAIEKAIAFLKAKQLTSGNFAAGWGNDNGNTQASVISGLVAAGEDLASSKWTVDGKTPIDTLAQYQSRTGGFMYRTSTGRDDVMASYQAIIAVGDLVHGDSVWKRIKLPDTHYVGEQPSNVELETAIETAAAYFQSGATRAGSDWSALGLARAGRMLPETYVAHLLNRAVISGGEFDQITDLERTILALTAAGVDAADVEGVNLAEKLYQADNALMTRQGLNGLIFALLALDSGHYEVPAEAAWTRNLLLNEILAKQHDDGGFSLYGPTSDPDMTAMAITAIAPYATSQPALGAVSRATDWLSANQLPNGGYLSYGADNSESVAQAIIALTALGLDPTGPAYTKNGVHLVDRLLEFRLADGAFSHVFSLQANGMATEQALQALLAYKLFKEGQGERLYDFTNSTPNIAPVDAAEVNVRVEGAERRIGEGILKARTPLEALDKLADGQSLDVKKNMNWGMLDLTIDDIGSGHYGETDHGYWNYAVKRDDSWLTSSQGAMDAIILLPGDEVLVYYGDFMTMAIDSIAASPTEVYEDTTIDVTVRKTEMDYMTFGWASVPAGGVIVALLDADGEPVVSRVTSVDGKASFGHQAAGAYTVSVSGYVTGGSPTLVHATKELTVLEGFVSELLPLPAGEDPRVVIPLGDKEYRIAIKAQDAGKGVTIQIPANKEGKTYLQLPAGEALPRIEVTRDGASLVIPQGITWSGQGSAAIELLTSVNKESEQLANAASSLLQEGYRLDNIHYAFSNGGGVRTTFSDFASLIFPGMAGKNAFYIENGQAKAIEKVPGDAEGRDSGNDEYAYDSGTNLIVKTNHFTEFVVYSASKGSGDGGNGNNPDPINQITLSVDKQTINKGYVVSPIGIELQAGDTAWSVLQRTLNQLGIPHTADNNSQYGSVYVRSIDGDGEFDHGSGSGWMYSVNGDYPDYGSSLYVLKAGDVVRWRYTTDMGADLGTPASPAGPSAGSSDSKPVINVPATGAGDFSLKVEKGWQSKELITLNIPNTDRKVVLHLDEVKGGIPGLKAIKGGLTFTIDKGTALKSGKPDIEVLTQLGKEDSELLASIRRGLIIGRSESLVVSHAFSMGSPDETVLFDRAVTLTVKDGKGQSAGFLENDVFTPILVYASNEKGKEATQGQEKFAYAYVQGNDLIMKTNHFTSFVTYTVDKLDLSSLYKDVGLIADWASEAIAEATALKFLEGDQGLFRPQGTVTRAQFAKLLSGIMGLNTGASGTISFNDVARKDWFYPYVNAAVEAGYMAGFGNGTFGPNQAMTREQMAVVLVKAASLRAEGALPVIADAGDVSPWAIRAVEIIVDRELMQGWNGKFQPKSAVTREMAAVVAMRAYGLLQEGAGTEEPGGEPAPAAKRQLALTAEFLQQQVQDPVIASIGGDWTVFGLARSGASVPQAYYDKYYANVEKELQEKEGKLHHVKYTEYDRVILGLSAIGRNVEQAAGYNLLRPLADYETVIKQGINGPIFALIALDSNGYDIPSDPSVQTQTTRQLLINFILGREIEGGGWALGANAESADSDLTAMAIQGLTPYYGSDAKVKAALDRALQWLSKTQASDGGYASGAVANLESTAQVVIALAGLGIDPHSDERFVKQGRSAVDALLGYADASGGFLHVQAGGQGNGGAVPGAVDLMATDQALLAMAAYVRLTDGKTRLYDLTDVK